MPERVFTPEQANALLPELRRLLADLIEHRRALADARRRRRDLAAKVAGNGGGLDPAAVADLDERVAAALQGVARSVNAVHALGVQVKDADEGLVDFPAERRGEPVYLCWRLGEDEVAYWHDLDSGYVGRQPL